MKKAITATVAVLVLGFFAFAGFSFVMVMENPSAPAPGSDVAQSPPPTPTSPSTPPSTPPRATTTTATEGEAPTTKVYESEDGVLSFEHAANLTVSPVSTGEISYAGEATIPVTYPADSIEIPGLFIVSRIPYPEISVEKPIVDYFNCCTGNKHWFDVEGNAWHAETIEPTEYDSDGTAHPGISKPYSALTKWRVHARAEFRTEFLFYGQIGRRSNPDKLLLLSPDRQRLRYPLPDA